MSQKKVGKERREDKSPRIFQRDKIDFDLHIRQREDFTENQRKLINLILDKETKIVFVSGPAGTSKTYLAIYCGLMLLAQKRLSELFYVRSVIESASKSLGSLPGDEKLKMEPFLMPLMDKLEELLPGNEIQALTKDERVKGTAINYLRGASLAAKFIIGDECQNFTVLELKTLLTRMGEFSKMVICADPLQSDCNGKSGFQTVYNLFDTEESRKEGIYCFKFGKEDIVRSGVLKHIIERFEETIKM